MPNSCGWNQKHFGSGWTCGLREGRSQEYFKGGGIVNSGLRGGARTIEMGGMVSFIRTMSWSQDYFKGGIVNFGLSGVRRTIIV